MAHEHGKLPSLAKLTVMDRLKVPTSIKVVVLCHSRPFPGHWQEAVIRERTSELFSDRIADGGTVDFFTLDPVPGSTSDFPHAGPQTLFKKTNFSTMPRFDMIWVPDCGGEWFEMMNMEGDAQSKRFVELALTMSRSLLPGGFIMMGKLPFDEDGASDTTLEQAVGLLLDAGFAYAELAPVPDPYVKEAKMIYIMAQTMK